MYIRSDHPPSQKEPESDRSYLEAHLSSKIFESSDRWIGTFYSELLM